MSLLIPELKKEAKNDESYLYTCQLLLSLYIAANEEYMRIISDNHIIENENSTDNTNTYNDFDTNYESDVHLFKNRDQKIAGLTQLNLLPFLLPSESTDQEEEKYTMKLDCRGHRIIQDDTIDTVWNRM